MIQASSAKPSRAPRSLHLSAANDCDGMKKGAREIAVSTLRRSKVMCAWVGGLVLAAASCKDEPPPPRPPPPAVKAATCSGAVPLADKESTAFFPPTSGGFCLDPNGGEKTFGDGGSLPLDKICDIFDGECEIYRGYNVRRVVELRYVDGSGSPATIDIHFSKFGTTEAAYAMFTKRVVGDGDPIDPATPRPVEGGGAAALGLGNAYLWRGLYLVELTYNDESAAEAAMRSSGERLLPPLVKEIGAKLPGEPGLPVSAAALPKDGMVPLGIRFETKDALGVDGAGGGAFGYYKEGDKRYRLLSLVRRDVDQAKDVLSSFAKLPGATREKNVADGATRAMRTDGDAPIEWIVARAGNVVMALGDESRVLPTGMSAEDHAKVSLTKEEKIAHVKKALGLEHRP